LRKNRRLPVISFTPAASQHAFLSAFYYLKSSFFLFFVFSFASSRIILFARFSFSLSVSFMFSLPLPPAGGLRPYRRRQLLYLLPENGQSCLGSPPSNSIVPLRLLFLLFLFFILSCCGQQAAKNGSALARRPLR
jgi:hypothetical protein